MRPVNYDAIASEYDTRYVRNRYDGIRACVHRHVGRSKIVAEVGCGTGHWLAGLALAGTGRLVGIDLSAGMLARARVAAPSALLLRATAERLPIADASLDRVFCVNALHHFTDAQAFIRECRRVLRPSGELLTIGLDPHHGGDRWWVYEYFPAALDADLRRYPAASIIRAWMIDAGFRDSVTEVAQHLPAEMSLDAARAQGFLDRSATSQLMVIGDAEYEEGIRRLEAERPLLRSDLRVYVTIGQT